MTTEAEEGAGQAVSSGEEWFERWRRRVGLLAGPLVGLAVWLLPLAGLTPSGHRLAAIVSGAVVWWITEAVPIPVTALFASALTVLLGLATAQEALAPFASPTIFLFMGSFILGEAITVHGLDRRLSGALLSVGWVGRSETRVRMAVGALAVGLSAWMSNTATTAMLLPMAIGLVGGGASAGRRPAGTGLMLVLAYSASLGGVATPVGTPPNLITIGMLERLAGVDIDFFRWMALGVPIALVGYGALVLITRWLYSGGPRCRQARRQSPSSGSPRRGRAEKSTASSPLARPSCSGSFPAWSPSHGAPRRRRRNSSARDWTRASSRSSPRCLLFLLPVNWKRRRFTV